MRWLLAACVMGLGCVAQEPVDAAEPSALTSEQAIDPCLWDGKGWNYCFAEAGAVFDGTACRGACMPNVEPRPGVFRTLAECEATCGR